MIHKEVCGDIANPNPCANGGACRVNLNLRIFPFGYICDCADGWTGDNCDEVEDEENEEEDSPLEEFLESLMEILDPNGPIATPVATIGVLGKSTMYILGLHRNCSWTFFISIESKNYN